MDKIKSGAEEIYLAPETESSVELALDEPIEESENEDVPVVVEAEPKKNVRVSEILDLRESNRKVYRMSDGTEQAVFYPETVHVFNDDTKNFDDVDNTIVEEEDGRHFVCGKNHFKARFSREEENDELFSIESGMHRVTVSAKKNKKHKNKGVKPKVHKKTEEGFSRTDALVFEAVQDGADYEYSVTGNGVKENIVVKEKTDVYRYPFVLHMENVTAEFDETNKRVAFLSKENGKEVFFIPAPFMTDANGIISTAVSYELKNTANGDAVFTVTPDSEWMNIKYRSFPVVIDPQIRLSGSGSIYSYTWNDGYMYKPSTHSVNCVDDGCGGFSENRLYLKMTRQILPNNPRIKNVKLELTVLSGYNHTNDVCKLGIYEVYDDITNGYTTPSSNNELLDYAGLSTTVSKNSKILFDVTNSMDKFYNGEIDVANFMVKFINNTTSAGITFYGDNNPDYSPKLIIEYEPCYKVDSSQNNTHSLGRFGIGSVDLRNGNLMFNAEEFAWEGNRMPVTIKHLYNSSLAQHKYTNNDSLKLNIADFSAMNIGLGWKLNVMQSMKYDSNANAYIFTDDNGKETYFLLSDKTTECESNSQCYQLYEDSDGNEMYYDDQKNALTYEGTRYFFDYSGRLIKVVNGNNEMNIHYTSGKITSVTDGSGRDFCFAYNGDGQLTSISAPDYSAENRNVITYNYTDNLLTKIVYPDGSIAEIQ